MPDPGFLGLLRQHVHSVWSLELLLLMRRQPTRLWRPDELVRELRASTPLVATALDELREAGLIRVEDDGAQYAPANPELQGFCDELAEVYRIRPVTLINLIASPSKLQGLADAFRFKGDSK